MAMPRLTSTILMRVKLSELVPNKATQLAAECERKGTEAFGDDARNYAASAVHFMGLCQVIHELRQRVEKLENK